MCCIPARHSIMTLLYRRRVGSTCFLFVHSSSSSGGGGSVCFQWVSVVRPERRRCHGRPRGGGAGSGSTMTYHCFYFTSRTCCCFPWTETYAVQDQGEEEEEEEGEGGGSTPTLTQTSLENPTRDKSHFRFAGRRPRWLSLTDQIVGTHRRRDDNKHNKVHI